MALEGGDRRNATVVAKTPLRIAVMVTRDFKEMEEEMPHVCERIAAAIKKRSEA
jgi:CRP-like cAMP-binding protein